MEENFAAPEVDPGLFLATSLKTGELVTRGGRPLFGTLDDWMSIAKSIPHQVVPTSEHGVPFGALPLIDYGKQPDVVGDLVKALDAVTKLTDMVAQRLARLDKVITECEQLHAPRVGAAFTGVAKLKSGGA